MIDTKTYELLMDFLTSDLSTFLMQDNEGLSMSEAISTVFNSEWYSKASDPLTGLYFQSAAYNYELLKHELKYGTLR